MVAPAGMMLYTWSLPSLSRSIDDMGSDMREGSKEQMNCVRIPVKSEEWRAIADNRE